LRLSICSTLFFDTFSTFSVELFLLLLLKLSTDLTDARFSSRFNFSSSFGTINFGTFVGGLGFGGGVDLPKECFFGDEIGTPEEIAAEATAEAATGGEERVPGPGRESK